MTPFERLEALVLMMQKRIEVIESGACRTGHGAPLDADEAAAQRQAAALGFVPAILTVPAKRSERVALARALRANKWSVARIARVLRTGERNVERWVRQPAAGAW